MKPPPRVSEEEELAGVPEEEEKSLGVEEEERCDAMDHPHLHRVVR
jgi:hypothetical protein